MYMKQDKDLEYISALCVSSKTKLSESLDPEIMRVAQAAGINLKNYLPSKSKSFQKQDLTVNYMFDNMDDGAHSEHHNLQAMANVATANDHIEPEASIYSVITKELLQDIKDAILNTCGTTYPDLDDPLVHQIVQEKTKRKKKPRKEEVTNILSRVYPYYNNMVVPFPGYNSLPILYPVHGGISWGIGSRDSDGDGIPNWQDPTPYGAAPVTTQPAPAELESADPGGDVGGMMESTGSADYQINATTGVVTLTYDGTVVSLSQSDSAAFKSDLQLISDDQQEGLIARYVEKTSLNEDVVETPLENIKDLAVQLSQMIASMDKISKADRFLINHLNAFVDRNTY